MPDGYDRHEPPHDHAAFADEAGSFESVTPAQLAFSVALGTLTVLITGFGVYVVSSTWWSGRWYRRGRRAGRR